MSVFLASADEPDGAVDVNWRTVSRPKSIGNVLFSYNETDEARNRKIL